VLARCRCCGTLAYYSRNIREAQRHCLNPLKGQGIEVLTASSGHPRPKTLIETDGADRRAGRTLGASPRAPTNGLDAEEHVAPCCTPTGGVNLGWDLTS